MPLRADMMREARRMMGFDPSTGRDETTVTLAQTTVPAVINPGLNGAEITYLEVDGIPQRLEAAMQQTVAMAEGVRNDAPPAYLPVPADYDYNQYPAAVLQLQQETLATWMRADTNSAPQSAIEPKLTAEQLLHKVLPQDLYIHLNAVGHFWLEPTRTKRLEVRHKETKQVYGHPPYRYQFFRNKKTHLHAGKDIYSSCIAPENTSCPDQDRLVAEYLLAKDKEAEYLATTNLTQVGGERARAGLIGMDGYLANMAADAARYANATRDAYDREFHRYYTGLQWDQNWLDERTVPNAPPQTVRAYQPPPTVINARNIAQMVISGLESHERLAGIRLPLIRSSQERNGGELWVESRRVQLTPAALEVPTEHFRELIRVHVLQLANQIVDHMDRAWGWWQLGLDNERDAATAVGPRNTSVRVVMNYDRNRHLMDISLEAGLVLRP